MATWTGGDGPATGERTRLSLLGPVDLRAPDGSRILSVLSQPRRVALLAYIAVEGHRGPVSRDRLLALFWSDRDDRRARKALRDALHFLRRSLDSHLLLTPGDEVGLDWDYFSCDAEEFLEGLEAGDGDLARALYRGEFMEGFHVSRARQFEEWLAERRRDFSRRGDLPRLSIGEGEGRGPVKPLQPTLGGHRHARSGRRRLVRWALAALVGVAGVALTYLGTRVGRAESAGPPSVEPHAAAIAVLPFDNISPDPDDAFFADGMHGQIITQLQKISSLRVISRTSVMQYAQVRPTTPEIAAELGVDFILEGTARRDRDNVRLTTQLIDAQTDELVWVEDYDRDLTVAGLFEIQDDLAGRVAISASAQVLPDEARQIAELPTNDPDAFDYYLQGRALWVRRVDRVAASYEAEAMFAAAVTADPMFVEAWAELVRIRAWLVEGHGDSTRRSSAREALRIAVELDEQNAMVQRAAGTYFKMVEQDYERARTYLRAANGITPHDPEVLFQLGEVETVQRSVCRSGGVPTVGGGP